MRIGTHWLQGPIGVLAWVGVFAVACGLELLLLLCTRRLWVRWVRARLAEPQPPSVSKYIAAASWIRSPREYYTGKVAVESAIPGLALLLLWSGLGYAPTEGVFLVMFAGAVYFPFCFYATSLLARKAGL